jgi:hypothetical protein
MNTTPQIGHREIDSQHAELDQIIDKALAFYSEANASTAGCTACWRKTVRKG